MKRIGAALLALLVATPLAAQEWQVGRQQFAFVGSRLTVRVDVEVPGTLHLIRGAPGSVQVAGRAQQGFASSGLAEEGRLTLTAAGPGPVDYLVAVPENVFVEVWIPGQGLAQRVMRGRAGSWEWNAAERPPQAAVTEWLPGFGADARWTDGFPLYTTFTRDVAPGDITLPDLSVIERVSVRLEGTRFRVITSRPLSVEEGSSRALVIRPAGPPMEVVLALPLDTRAFTLRLGDHIALLVDGTTITTLCAPVTEQWLSRDRRWYTFNPTDGSLHCGGDAIQRHGG